MSTRGCASGLRMARVALGKTLSRILWLSRYDAPPTRRRLRKTPTKLRIPGSILRRTCRSKLPLSTFILDLSYQEHSFIRKYCRYCQPWHRPRQRSRRALGSPRKTKGLGRRSSRYSNQPLLTHHASRRFHVKGPAEVCEVHSLFQWRPLLLDCSAVHPWNHLPDRVLFLLGGAPVRLRRTGL